MSPTQIIALGPALLPYAREYTNDLNQAHYLVHRVVAHLAVRSGIGGEPFVVADARSLMSTFARQDGLAGCIAD